MKQNIISPKILPFFCLLISLASVALADDLAPFGSYAQGTSGGLFVEDIYSQGPGWTFYFTDGTDSIQYYLLASEVSQGIVTIHTIYNNNPGIIPVYRGGTNYRDASGNVQGPEQTASRVTLLSATADQRSLTLVFSENDVSHNTKTYVFTIQGKTLVLDVSASATINSYLNNYAGFSLGSISGFQQKHILLDYMHSAPVNIVLDASRQPLYFYTLYLDQTQTNAQWYNKIGCNQQDDTDPCYITYTYGPRKNNQEVMPLKERIYLTVSDKINDVMVKINNNPSTSYKNLLQTKTQIDIYDESFTGIFNKDAIVLEWTADSTGQARIQTAAQRQGFTGCIFAALIPGAQSGGSTLLLKKNTIPFRTEVFPGFDKLRRTMTDTLSVNQGDKIRFVLSTTLNNFCEHMSLDVTISLNGRDHLYPQEYSTTQGRNGWNYYEYTRDQYQPLSYDPTLDRWQTKEYRSYISRTGMSPPMHNFFYMTGDFVDQLSTLGIADYVFFYGRHGKNGWDVTWPDLYPSTEIKGGSLGIISLGSKVKSRGNLFSLYYIHSWLSQRFPSTSPNYYALYGNAAFKAQDGTPYVNPYWSNTGIGYCPGGFDACFDLPNLPRLTCPLQGECYRGGSFVVVDYGKIARPYNGNAPFLDIDSVAAEQAYDLTAVYTDAFLGSPSNVINHFDDDSTTKTISGVLTAEKEVLSRLKQIHGGPVASEGWGDISLGQEYKAEQRADVLNAGYVDGMSYPPDAYPRSQITFIPNFVHKAINPLMVPHGVGFRDRFFKIMAGQQIYGEQDYNFDLYRAMLLGYGFANYLDVSAFYRTPFEAYSAHINNFVKEYYMVRALQPEYRLSQIRSILYNAQGQLVDLSEAIRRGVDFTNDQVYLEYTNGFRIYINYNSRDTWTISNTPKGTIVLPPYGFVAWKPGGVFASSSLRDGHRADYVESSAYILTDGRGVLTNFGSISSKYLTVQLASGSSLFCQPTFGCYNNFVARTPTGLQTNPSLISSTAPMRIQLIGSFIHPDAQLYYKGNLIDHQYYSYVDNTLLEIHSNRLFDAGTSQLEIRNPGDRSGFVTLNVGSSPGSNNNNTGGNQRGDDDDDTRDDAGGRIIRRDTSRGDQTDQNLGDVGDTTKQPERKTDLVIIKESVDIGTYLWRFSLLLVIIVVLLTLRYLYVRRMNHQDKPRDRSDSF